MNKQQAYALIQAVINDLKLTAQERNQLLTALQVVSAPVVKLEEPAPTIKKGKHADALKTN